MSIIGHGVEVVADATARTSIVNPPNGVLVFQLSDKTLWAWAGSAWRQIIYDNSASLTPTGALMSFAGSAAPTGWLLCAGQTLNSITTPDYAALFSVIGTTYGGTGASNFMIPDLRGRTIAGLDNMNGTDAGRIDLANTLGTAAGAQYHTLSTSEMPSHTHTQDSHNHSQNAHSHSDAGHGHQIYFNSASMAYSWSVWTPGGAGWNIAQMGGVTTGYANIQNTTATNIATTATNQNTGGGGQHNNMQPTILLNYIIKL